MNRGVVHERATRVFIIEDPNEVLSRRIRRLPAHLGQRIARMTFFRALREAAGNREIDRAMARIAAAAETEDEETKAEEADETAREERLQ